MAQTQPVWPDEVFADLDRTGPVPLYYQVATRLEAAIQDGTIPGGARLENEIEIAGRLGLSRPTVRRAIQDLVDKGMLVRRRGIGTQVIQAGVTRPVELTSLYEDLKEAHHEPGTRVLSVEQISAPDHVAEFLQLDPGAEVLHLRRVRSTDGTPVSVLENYLPADLVAITEDLLETHGLYQLLRSRGITIRVAKQRIGARRARGDEHTLLDIDRTGPVLTMDRISFDAGGRVIEFGRHCYRPDMYSFETTLVAK